MNKKLKVGQCALLSMALAGTMMPIPVYAKEDDHPTEKTETVYTVLDQNGSIVDSVISSWLHDEDGINDISEVLDESNVENIKSDTKPTINGNIYTWNSESNDIYYQGNSNKKLPIGIQISYELDGQSISAKDVAGKSGHLKLLISITNNESRVVNINGKNITIHPSFLGAGMLKLDSDHIMNIDCKEGKILNDGTNEILTFLSAPGLNETLNQVGLEKVRDALNVSDTVQIEADVKDFDLGSIMFAFTNEMSFDDLTSQLSIGDVTSGVDELLSASNQLLDGSKTLYEGTEELNNSAKPLTSAYPQIEALANATSTLHTGTSTLLEGIDKYTQGVTALDSGNKQLYGISSGITQSYSGAKTLQKGAENIQAGLKQLEQKVNTIDENSLNELTSILEQSKQQLFNMSSLVDKDQSILSGMQSSLSNLDQAVVQLESLKSAYENAVTQYNNAVETNNQIVDSNNQIISNATEKLIQSANATNSSIDETINTLNGLLENTEDENVRAVINSNIASLQSKKIDSSNLGTDKLVSLEKVDSSNITNVVDKISNGVTILSTTLSSSLSSLNELKEDITLAQNGLANMQEMIDTAEGKTPEGIDVLIGQLKDAITQLSKGSDTLVTGCIALDTGLEELSRQSTQGITQINEGSQQLVMNNEALLSGATQLNQGAEELENQKSTFFEMSEGLQKLQTAFDELEEGANQLYDGQSQFSEQGMSKLKEMVDLSAGELETLQSVIDQINTLNKEYQSFAGAPKNAECKLRFVFRTSQE